MSAISVLPSGAITPRSDERTWRIALVPKGTDNPFYFPTRAGCHDQAVQLSLMGDRPVECLFIGPEVYEDDADGLEQGRIVTELLDSKAVDAIAVAVRRTAVMQPILERAYAENIPVVTFDADSPNAPRAAYIGTDNYFFGQTIAKVLKQLQPDGGTFGTLTSAESANLHERLEGFLDEMMKDGKWQQVPESPYDVRSNHTRYLEGMQKFANADVPPTAIAPVMASTIQFDEWRAFVEEHARKNITLVSGDSSEIQLQFLERGYVYGLVGQLPYEMGSISAKVLYSLLSGANVSQPMMGTNVLTFIQVPLILPELNVNNNLIGNLHVVGFILFGLIAVASLGISVWIYRSRNMHVVKVSQPMFLAFVLVGTITMASSMIPLSFDDSRNLQDFHEQKSTLICMSVPWLASTGFTVTFAALFSKTMRVNKIFHNQNSFARVHVSIRDVLVPLIILLMANWAILTWWTVQDPLIYIRQDLPGLDGWNRVIATYGSCKSNNVWRYLAPMAFVNFSCLALANWQAYEARQIQSEFAESKYIALTVASMLQAMLCGFPVLFVVKESPQAFYLTVIFLLFTISLACLALIFVPKMVLAHQFSNRSDREQRQYIMSSIRNAATQNKRSSSALIDVNDSGFWELSEALDGSHERGIPSKSPVNSTASGRLDSRTPSEESQTYGKPNEANQNPTRNGGVQHGRELARQSIREVSIEDDRSIDDDECVFRSRPSTATDSSTASERFTHHDFSSVQDL